MLLRIISIFTILYYPSATKRVLKTVLPIDPIENFKIEFLKTI